MLWMGTFKIKLPMAVSGKYKNAICIYQIQIKLHSSTTEFKKNRLIQTTCISILLTNGNIAMIFL
jgi:hypothetical protein